ncbi:RpiR family transcriptional regulator [Salsuginibacillus halophilus]|uniref:RpiR family transcriptional regulator n=1 Tax=Salsuginibacillus halophilus TaxID=517424 RepID=A0A2P8HL52_9BACI|nr:SIS domain-containing protein [Salsuginibacillus halophilus]PSL46948.1 RpiR family transcriptional regulator [Salsuginibacillus halophilus]
MLTLRTDHLTELEKTTHETLTAIVREQEALTIVKAAEVCGVSPSKISKLVRKLGFESFKQYKRYFSGQEEVPKKQPSSEIRRLLQFLEHYDPAPAADFVSIFHQFPKVILFGLGPSHIAAEYFSYKLQTVTEKNILVTHHEDYANQLVGADTLLVIFSVTGTFTSFEPLIKKVQDRGGQVTLVLEEPLNTRDSSADYIFQLSSFPQDPDLQAFEKTRTIFFIFMEEVISRLQQQKNHDTTVTG